MVVPVLSPWKLSLKPVVHGCCSVEYRACLGSSRDDLWSMFPDSAQYHWFAKRMSEIDSQKIKLVILVVATRCVAARAAHEPTRQKVNAGQQLSSRKATKPETESWCRFAICACLYCMGSRDVLRLRSSRATGLREHPATMDGGQRLHSALHRSILRHILRTLVSSKRCCGRDHKVMADVALTVLVLLAAKDVDVGLSSKSKLLPTLGFVAG